MTDLNKRLAEEYVVDYNITKAAERANIQGDNKRIIAWQMLQLEDVQQYVEQLQEEAALRSQISKDEWIAEWRKLGFSNIQNYMDNDLNAKPLNEVKDPQAIKSIKKTVTESEFGSKTQIEFTLHDKVAGLTNIGKHFGWYEKDNEQQRDLQPKTLKVEIVPPTPLD